MAKRRKFEGADVVEVRSAVRGRVGDTRLDEPLAPETRVVVVVEGVVNTVAHRMTDGGLVRVQVVKPTDGFVLTDETDAVDLIHKLRSDRKAALDELLGTPPLDGFDDAAEEA